MFEYIDPSTLFLFSLYGMMLLIILVMGILVVVSIVLQKFNIKLSQRGYRIFENIDICILIISIILGFIMIICAEYFKW